MRLVVTLLLVAAFPSAARLASAQVGAGQNTNPAPQKSGGGTEKNETTPQAALPDEPSIWIHLAGGRRIKVDEVAETTDGLWYTQANVTTFLERARVVRIERSEDRKPASTPDTFVGSGRWKISDSARVENFFLSQFNRPLPLTAFGQSELHTRWGLDHRNGMDVGLHPDSVEGKALIKFLLREEIPFLAFRASVPGVATGPHIHVGNGSHRLRGRQ